MENGPGEQAPNAWRVVVLLFLANLNNFYDRTIPAIVVEPVRLEWGLTDFQLGLLTAAFTVVYAIAGLPLGRLADTVARRKVMGWGLAVWSAFTAANAAAWSYGSFLAMRVGVGIGEASYAPASNSLIGDLFPAERRSRALGVFMLGLPLGLLLAFFTVGAMVEAFGSWRAPFVVAAIPGFVLAACMFFIREPERGASETVRSAGGTIDRPIRRVLAVPTLLWLVLSGVTINFAAYAGNGFLVPMLQRYFGLGLETAAITTGCVVGLTGLVGLTAGGWLADAVHRRSERGRLLLGAGSMVVAAVCTGAALASGAGSLVAFAVLFGAGWLAYYNYYTCVYPAIQDVVEPRLRATAVAVYFAGMYLLGGAFGPAVVGALSDRLAQAAMRAEGAAAITEAHRAVGLHDALWLVPVALLLTGVFVALASRSVGADSRRMQERLATPDAPAPA